MLEIVASSGRVGRGRLPCPMGSTQQQLVEKMGSPSGCWEAVPRTSSGDHTLVKIWARIFIADHFADFQPRSTTRSLREDSSGESVVSQVERVSRSLFLG